VPKIEKLAVKALSSLDGNQSGRYYALKSMKEAEHQQLIEDHFLFNKPVLPLLLAFGMARNRPDACSIWLSCCGSRRRTTSRSSPCRRETT
jgi:creatine kinase